MPCVKCALKVCPEGLLKAFLSKAKEADLFKAISFIQPSQE